MQRILKPHCLAGEPTEGQKVKLQGHLQDLSKYSAAAMRLIVAAEKAVLGTADEKEMMTMNLTRLKQTADDSEEVHIWEKE